MNNNIEPLTRIVTEEFMQLVAKHKLENINFKYLKKRYLYLNFVLITITFLLWFFLIISFMNIPLAFFTRLHSFGVLLQVIIFIASLVTLSFTGWLTLKYWKAIKLQKLIIQELPLAKLYQTGLELFTTKQYQITEIKKEFNLFPQAAVPPSRQIKQDYVLNFNKGKNNYSFGTLTRKEVTGSGENSDVVYTRYPYLTIDVNESLTLVATIKAMRTFLKIFKTKDNTSLEATEFEKIFAVDANDQILIRKLLTPKVILNLIELANNKIKIPLMQFDGRYITIAFNRYNVLNFNDPKGSLLGVFFIGSYQEIITNLVDVIQKDLNWLLESLQWIEVYGF